MTHSDLPTYWAYRNPGGLTPEQQKLADAECAGKGHQQTKIDGPCECCGRGSWMSSSPF